MMGREIKFRAWDKERKDMRQIQLMDWSDWWVSTGHTWEREKGLQYGERNSFKNEETDRHILMQYTGLKDKNGREIYEGDFIQNENTIGEIEWVQEHCAFMAFTRNPSFYRYLESDGQFNLTEIIGNIYENPELLEV